MAESKPLTDQKALVTGSSKGIGQGIAIELAKAGADVAINYHTDQAGAETTAHTVREAGRQAMIVQGDVGDPAQIDAMFEQIESQWGALDILVNNAGISPHDPFLDTTPEKWNRVIATNLTGPAFCAKAALRGMVGRGSGRIVNISSVHAEATMEGVAHYAASKGGIDALTRALAVEFGPKGISVNALVVGCVEQATIAENLRPRRAEWEAVIPRARWGQPADIGRMVVFLCQPGSDWVNGACIRIDGGQLAVLVHPSRRQ